MRDHSPMKVLQGPSEHTAFGFRQYRRVLLIKFNYYLYRDTNVDLSDLAEIARNWPIEI